MKDYIKKYNEFWKEIVENKDGTLNKDQVMRELADYYMVLDNCECAYDLMTCGLISKPNTYFEQVRSLFDENYIHKNMAKDDLVDSILCEEMTYKEIIEAIKDYFS